MMTCLIFKLRFVVVLNLGKAAGNSQQAGRDTNDMATRMAKKATPKQIERAILLLGKANYNTGFVDANFKRLGATMIDRDCAVESWLAAKTESEIEMLLERLRNVTQSEGRDKSITTAV
jgi:hypothetical protein